MLDNHPPEVVFEDNHLLVVDKPAGWLVQADKTRDQTLTDWGRSYLKIRYNKPGNVFLHPAHRLDRPVSGLVVFARTSKSLGRINELFRGQKVEKYYLAIVQGQVDKPGRLIHWIVKNHQNNRVSVYSAMREGAKEARLRYEPIATKGDHSLVLVRPETGRSHQIRAQFSRIRHPIIGDLKYDFPLPNPDKSISLHAFKLEFVHPVRKERLVMKSVPQNKNWDIYRENLYELD